MRRRDAFKLAALSAGAAALPISGASTPVPIIDTHIHLFDTLRPGGVPWPEKTDTAIYKPALPDRFAKETAALGVVGAIAIEASPLVTDNQWLLNVAADHPSIVGVVGDLVPSAESFADDLERLRGNTLFLGIRYGNLWNRDLGADLETTGFVEGLKALAAAGLVLETANPDPALIDAVVEVAERVPNLRIVMDHLPNAAVPAEADARDRYWAKLRLLAASPRAFVKLSQVPVRTNGKLTADPRYYETRLDELWDVFGEGRVMFGSDWPNSDHVATYAQTLRIVRSYLGRKSIAAQDKFFWKNSVAAYRWQRRRQDQPGV